MLKILNVIKYFLLNIISEFSSLKIIFMTHNEMKNNEHYRKRA
jgi:hypothetical protein